MIGRGSTMIPAHKNRNWVNLLSFDGTAFSFLGRFLVLPPLGSEVPSNLGIKAAVSPLEPQRVILDNALLHPK